MNHILKIKKLNENAVVPAQATAGSAGMDLSSCLDNDVIIAPVSYTHLTLPTTSRV